MKQATLFLEGKLKLTVNRKKTHIVHSDNGVIFIGIELYSYKTEIQERKIREFKDKVRKATRRNSPVNLKEVIKNLKPILRGFGNYFKIARHKWLYNSLHGQEEDSEPNNSGCGKSVKGLHPILRQLSYKAFHENKLLEKF